ncbi:MAG: peptide-methionine (S)-S-oxide reductase MsrA [Brevefilum sp.]
MSEKKATFAAGCFWGVEAHLQNIDGVIETVVGYTGGKVENPTYHMVCTDKTGHAEAVQVTYDSDEITYEQLVREFFDLHNPTTPNRQGLDVGSQYRSAIFYHNQEQKETAEKVKKELNQSDKYNREIVTEIVPVGDFYKAEDYHQDYYAKHSFRRS